MQSEKKSKLINLVGLLVGVQIILMTITQAIFIFENRTVLTDRICSTILKVAVIIVFVLAMLGKDELYELYPTKFGLWYVVATVVVLTVIVTTPVITRATSHREIFYLVYGSVVVPVFEEIIFRGYVWKRLETIFANKWLTYLMNAVLFGLWHLGYVYTISFHMEQNQRVGNLAFVMFMKVLVGVGYGLILGLLRMKTKNCYSTILLHALLNTITG